MRIQDWRRSLLVAALYFVVTSLNCHADEILGSEDREQPIIGQSFFQSFYSQKGHMVSGTNVASGVTLLDHPIGGFTRHQLRTKLGEWILSGEDREIDIDQTVEKAFHVWPGDQIQPILYIHTPPR